MYEKLLKKARQAKSVDELISLAGKENITLSKDDADALFSRLNSSGSLNDDELEFVSGGGCRTDVGGTKKTVVSCGCKCFTGQYELNFDPKLFKDVENGRIGTVVVPLPNMSYVPLYTKDNKELRMLWSTICGYGDCGSCSHLSFKGGLGYCSVS